jgi:hypothetical protein
MSVTIQTPNNVSSGGGGGGFTPTCFQAVKNSTPQTTTGTYADITGFDEDVNQGSDYTFNGTTGVLTLAAGTYVISAWALTTQTANNRHQLDIRLMRDTGSGFAVTGVESAQDMQYASRNTAQNDGSAQINNFLLPADTGDDIKLQMRDIGVAGTVGQNDVRISVFKISDTGRT